jgi:hypothetical protein
MRWLALACAAAVVASLGDVLMLYVATGNAPLASAEGRALLHVGGWLGVLAIPGYYLGYRECARRLPRDKRRALASTLGALVAMFGAATHGLTAMDIYEALTAGAQTRLPQAAFVPGWSALFVCGVAAAIAALLVTVVLTPALWRSDSGCWKLAATLNPITGTLVLSAIGLASAELAAYLSPAAPNLAHAVFFALCARAVHAERKS